MTYKHEAGWMKDNAAERDKRKEKSGKWGNKAGQREKWEVSK